MPLRSPAATLAVLLCLLFCGASARAADFIDAAGRRVDLPSPPRRVLPADRNAEVLVFVLAPEKLAGLERVPGRGALVPPAGRPALLGWRLRSAPADMAATARQVGADLIIDAGKATPERAAFADQVQQQSGIPYILVDDSVARTAALLRSIGALLGVADRGEDLALFAEHAIASLRGQLLIAPANARPRIYYARGRYGLITSLPGSPAGAALDEAGAINVAGALGRGTDLSLTPAQLVAFDPDIIIAEQQSAYHRIRTDPALRSLKAVRQRHVYLAPNNPFGWIEDPSGINRLIGLYWLAGLLYPSGTQQDLRATTCDFYDKFYRIKLTNRRLEAMLRPAGVAPPDIGQQVEPLVGLGAAPPSTLPGGAAGAVNAVQGGHPVDTCTIPGGPTPIGLPDKLPPGYTSPDTLPPVTLPGVAPSGRLGRSAPGAGPPPPVPPMTIPGVPLPGRRGRVPTAPTEPLTIR